MGREIAIGYEGGCDQVGIRRNREVKSEQNAKNLIN